MEVSDIYLEVSDIYLEVSDIYLEVRGSVITSVTSLLKKLTFFEFTQIYIFLCGECF